MDNYEELYRELVESRHKELEEMVADFSVDGCIFLENLFVPFLRAAEHGNDYSCDNLMATFEDENGNEIAFILSQDEIGCVADAVTQKLNGYYMQKGGAAID